MPGPAGEGVPGLAGVSGIGGECFSWMGGGGSAVTGLLLIQVPGMPAVTRRARASGPGRHYGPAGSGGSAEARTVIRSCPACRAVGVARVLLVAGNLVELCVLAPQIPPKAGSAA